jgi:glutathione S-transferase
MLRTSLATAGSPVVTAYTLDRANEVPLLGEFPNPRAYLERMCIRPNAPPRIAQALASMTS